MLNYNMSIENFKEMIKKPEYKAVQMPFKPYPEFEALNFYGVDPSLFEDLADQLGRIPTQTEYINKAYAQAVSYFTDPKHYRDGISYLNWMNKKTKKWNNNYPFKFDDRLKYSITQRASRTYPSLITEYSTILTLRSKFPFYAVAAHDHLDSLMGVDIVVSNLYADQDKSVYLHVHSGSPDATNLVKDKATRPVKRTDSWGKAHYYKRDFSKGHFSLTFSKYPSKSTEYINGIPFIKESYITEVLDKAFYESSNTDNFNCSQIQQLNNFLIDNHIDSNGTNGMWVPHIPITNMKIHQ
ncbi:MULTISPECIES: hypothetical protein [Gammaproteobacteria]|uniref:hypothetical protein n=1 Tax=Acinetobacter sp. HRXRD-152 TaxID=3404808 RepID=UPI003BB5D929